MVFYSVKLDESISRTVLVFWHWQAELVIRAWHVPELEASSLGDY